MQDWFLAYNGNFMVSFALDIVKFLLIYRYLQNIYWFKREIVLLSIPHIKALALPILVEQTTSEPTPIWKSLPQRDLYKTFDCIPMVAIYAYKVSAGFWYNHTRDIYRCFVQDQNIDVVARFRCVLNRASDKRLLCLDWYSHPMPAFV